MNGFAELPVSLVSELGRHVGIHFKRVVFESYIIYYIRYKYNEYTFFTLAIVGRLRKKPRRQSGQYIGFWIFIRVIYTMVPPHGHLICVNISLMLNSFFYNTPLFAIKRYPCLCELYLYLIGVNISLMLNSFFLIIQHYLMIRYPYLICVLFMWG